MAVDLSPAKIVFQNPEFGICNCSTVEARHWCREVHVLNICWPKMNIVGCKRRNDSSNEFTKASESDATKKRGKASSPCSAVK